VKLETGKTLPSPCEVKKKKKKKKKKTKKAVATEKE